MQEKQQRFDIEFIQEREIENENEKKKLDYMKKQEEEDKQLEVERNKAENKKDSDGKKKEAIHNMKFEKTKATPSGFFEGISRFFSDLVNM